MNLSTWLVSTVLAATAVLAIGWMVAAHLRRHAAWENALVRVVLLLLLVLPVTQALAPRLPGMPWLEQQRANWSARWFRAPAASAGKEASKAPASDAATLRLQVLSTVHGAHGPALVQGLLWVWIVGASVSLSGLALGLREVRRLLDASELLPASAYAPALESWVRLAGVSLPTVRAVKGLPSPVLVGWRQPRILVPASGVAPSREVLLHELAHLRRGDLWWLYLGRAACALWWFHPLAWMTRRRLERSAENVCDDLVVLWTQSPCVYAEQLLSFVPTPSDDEEVRWLAGVAMAGHRSELGQRIGRMLEPGRQLRVTIGGGGLASLLAGAVLSLLLLTAVCASRGQTVPATGPATDHVAAPIPGSDPSSVVGKADELPAPGEGKPLTEVTQKEEVILLVDDGTDSKRLRDEFNGAPPEIHAQAPLLNGESDSAIIEALVKHALPPEKAIDALTLSDATGLYRVSKENRRRHLYFSGLSGEKFDGDIETPQEQAKVPAAIWATAKLLLDTVAPGGRAPEE